MNSLQLSIRKVVDDWTHCQDCPIPLTEIYSSLDVDISRDVVKYSIRALIKQGYLRRSIARSEPMSYIQLRR